MSKLGTLLKEEREKKGLSIHEVGLTLKISPKILKAIEEGIEKDLPAKTFIRGFVKSYASYLKIDSQKVLDLFAEEYSPSKETAARSEASDSSSGPQENKSSSTSVTIERSSRKSKDELSAANQSTNKNFTIIAAGVLLIAIAFVAKMMDKYKKESNTSSQAELIESLSTTTTTLPAPEDLVAESISEATPDETAKGNSAALISSASIANAKSNPANTPLVSAPPATTTTTSTTTTLLAKTPTTTTTSTTLKALAPSTTTTTTSTTTSTSTTTTTLVKNTLTEVIVEALNQVKIRFTLNGGQKWETIELAADKVHTFRSHSNIELEISDGGAVNVIINGRDRGVPGTIGKPIKLSYPK